MPPETLILGIFTSLIITTTGVTLVLEGMACKFYTFSYDLSTDLIDSAGRFGHQHLFNNLYRDFHYQAIHSRSDNQVLVEGNVFRGDTPEALSTYGLVVPSKPNPNSFPGQKLLRENTNNTTVDSPNTSPDGDFEIDGFANLGASKKTFLNTMSSESAIV